MFGIETVPKYYKMLPDVELYIEIDGLVGKGASSESRLDPNVSLL